MISYRTILYRNLNSERKKTMTVEEVLKDFISTKEEVYDKTTKIEKF